MLLRTLCILSALAFPTVGVAWGQAAAGDAAAGCVTFVNAARSPANLRFTPGGELLSTLDNGTDLVVDDDASGWLHVTSPATGWLNVADTSVRCETIAAIVALGHGAAKDRVAADTLVRYALVADGSAARAAAVAIGKLMPGNALQLIAALDQLPAPQRRQVLLDVIENGATAAQLRAFSKAVPADPSLATLSTWSSIVSHCDARILALYAWLCQ
jgi:hypothetical protein